MKVQFISAFPDMFDSVMNTSMMRKAQEIGVVQFSYIDLRKFGIGPRKQIDDIVYGGGDGMLLKPEPIFEAVAEAKSNCPKAKIYYMGPKGQRLNHSLSSKMAKQHRDMIIICGRYEGVDERVMTLVDQQISIGDYIITGGELAAMVFVESIVRLIPGVLGGVASAENESFSDGQTLEHPHYTRPEIFRDMKVPDVLLSGNHAEIAKWRNENSPKVKE